MQDQNALFLILHFSKKIDAPCANLKPFVKIVILMFAQA